MSEEEIIKYLKTIKPKNFNNYKDETPCSLITKKQIKAIQGLLDLYNKEKEKSKYYEEELEATIEQSVSKYKIKDKISNLKAMINEFENSGGGLSINPKYEDEIEVLEELLQEGENNE